MGFRSALIASLALLAPGLPALCHATPPDPASVPIVIGQRFQIRSESIGEMRSYLVHRPASYDLSTTRYPLLIVLDGEDDFQHASTTADLLADAGRIPGLLC